MSKGLERYKMFLHSCGSYASAHGSRLVARARDQ
jgi:hypothetical protein